MAISIEPAMMTALTFLAWFLGSYLYHAVGITLGYHRLLTHKSLKVPRWLMYGIVSGGYLCAMGSPVVWVGVHRLHHQKSDQPGDPHSPRDGFHHALIGWMTSMADVQTSEDLHRSAGELMNDRWLTKLGVEHDAYQAQLCLAINVAVRLVFLAFFGWLPVIANLLAMFIVFFSTQFVNTYCHMKDYGYRLFETREESRNVWWVAVLTCGEGWHNNHHAIPRSARHGMAWWEVDVTWCTVWLLEKLGLASEIVRPAPERMPWFKGNAHPAPVAAKQASNPVAKENAQHLMPPMVHQVHQTQSASKS